MGDMKQKLKPQQPKASQKPFKRSAYLLTAGLIALGVSGALAFFTYQPQWKVGFSYQLVPDSEKIQADTPVKASSGLASTDPVVSQIEILRSDRFMDDIHTALENQGITGWPAEKVAHAIKITNPLHSDLIRVEVETPHQEASQLIASELNKSYVSYQQTLQKEIINKEKAFVDNSLKQVRDKLADGETNIQDVLASDPQLHGTAFTNDPAWGEKTLTQGYEDLSLKLKDLESEMALEDTQYHQYSALLNRDEKTLVEAVILGEDPVVNKIADQMASAQTDANILSIKYTPQYPEMADASSRIKTLQLQLDAEGQKILGSKGGASKPIIRDSLRKSFIQELLTSKIKLMAAAKTYKALTQQRDELLQHLDHIASNVGDYNAWMLQKSMLQNTINTLEKQSDDLDYQLKTLPLPVKLFEKIPGPSQTQDLPHTAGLFFTAFSGLFLLLSAVPFVLDYKSSLIPTVSVLGILKNLLKTKGQQIIMMMPVSSSGHLTASSHLGGLLNQFGRDALVMDVDLCHRLLSRKIPLEHPYGIFEHMLAPDMKKPYADPLSGAKILPLEATLEADKIVEFSQVIQRLPRIWERWSSSVVILDISQWHEAYHQLLPYITQVIFYVPPSHKSSILLPKVFKGKYNVPVSLVEIQPEM